MRGKNRSGFFLSFLAEEDSIEDITALVDNTPVGRIGNTHDIASAALYLASDDADFITGQVLGVNGGYVI